MSNDTTERNPSQETSKDQGDGNIFIKVHRDALKKLIQDNQLSLTDIGHLVVLALFINSNNHCYPGRKAIADMLYEGHDRSTIRKTHNKLKKKGVLDWESRWKSAKEHDSNGYTLPDCFSFGSAPSNVDHSTLPLETGKNGIGKFAPTSEQNEGGIGKNAPRGLGKNAPRGIGKNAPRGIGKFAPITRSIQPDPIEQDPDKQEQEIGQAFGLTPKQKGDPVEHLRLTRSLIDAGVKDKEAYYIPQQYDPQLISETITAAAQKPLKNRGGWIRSVIETQAGRKIQYPNSTGQSSTPQLNQGDREKNRPPEWEDGAAAARAINLYLEYETPPGESELPNLCPTCHHVTCVCDRQATIPRREMDRWIATLNQVQLQVSETTFETWLEPISPLELRDNILFIEVANDLAKGHIDRTLLVAMNQTYQSILGSSQTVIETVVRNE